MRVSTVAVRVSSALLAVTFALGLVARAYAAPAITTVSLPAGQIGTPYSQTLTATGGTAPYTWAVTVGTLPSGLSLAASGAITGTPTATGTANFTVRVTDVIAGTVTAPLSIAVSPAALVVSTSSLPAGQIGVAYSQTVTATGGTAPYTWAVTVGALPAGLTLAPATGVISGTPTTAATANFTVRATDATALTATASLSITVSATAPLSVATTTLPAGQVGVGYGQSVTASGGTPPYTWIVSAGALPTGLSLATSGAISGTPTSSQTANFTVRVTDATAAQATRALAIVVNAGAPLQVTSTALPGGSVSSGYATTLSATGGTPPYTWVLSAGSTPLGVALDSSGQVSGTPIISGDFSFTATVTDALAATAQGSFTISISSGLLSVTITTTSLSSGAVGATYSDFINVGGGSSPYTWIVSSGSLPPGLTLSSSGGGLSGTPTSAGDYSFTVTVQDNIGASAAQSYLLSIAGQSLVLNETTLPGASVNVNYSASLTTSGGSSPYAWSVTSGTLPAGLFLDASSGSITGVPTVAGTASFTIRVSDNAGQVVTRQLSIDVTAPGFVGTAPAPGQIALLVTRGAVTSTELNGVLSLVGCNFESIGVLRSGRWLILIAGAPAVVNAAFPTQLADVSPFFVRCR